MNTDCQWSNQEACFGRATRVWLAVNHNTSVTSGKWAHCWKHITWACELGSCQTNACNSWGYEQLQKSKDSLKDCFENVNIILWNFGAAYSELVVYCSALTLDDERRVISNLISGFVRQISFGRDFEQQLSFYVESRSSFTNLDIVLVQLIQVLIDFSLTVMAATLIFISRRGSAISSAKEEKSGFIYDLLKR